MTVIEVDGLVHCCDPLAAALTVVLVVNSDGWSDAARPAASYANPLAVYDERNRQVAELAQRRSQALMARDEAAWLADVDAGVPPLVERERVKFANLRQLRPSFYGLKASRGSDHAETTSSFIVTQAIRLRSDVRNSENNYRWMVTFTGGKPLITAAGPLVMPNEYAGARDAPWDETPLRFAQSGPVIFASGRDNRSDPQAYMPVALRAHELVTSLWGKRKAAWLWRLYLGSGALWVES